MYLLAIKSFYRALGHGRIVIINDGTLSTQDIQILDRHVRPSDYVQAKDLTSSRCPSYISWKKLYCLSSYIQEGFAIQLDSDTLTLGQDIPEVKQCIKEDRSFILGTWKGQKIAPMVEAIELAKKNPSNHVQMISERNFDKLPNYEQKRYVRGCSGFDGFSKNSFNMDMLESFSSRMYEIIGAKWNEWGSEQTISNVIVANSERAMLLPYPKYYNYWGKVEPGEFVHFVGSHRYHGSIYLNEAKKIIRVLLEGS
jgi:hypothetical protein